MKLTTKQLRRIVSETIAETAWAKPSGAASAKKNNLGDVSSKIHFAAQDFARAAEMYDRVLWNNTKKYGDEDLVSTERDVKASLEKLKSAVAAVEEWMADSRPTKRYD